MGTSSYDMYAKWAVRVGCLRILLGFEVWGSGFGVLAPGHVRE